MASVTTALATYQSRMNKTDTTICSITHVVEVICSACMPFYCFLLMTWKQLCATITNLLWRTLNLNSSTGSFIYHIVQLYRWVAVRVDTPGDAPGKDNNQLHIHFSNSCQLLFSLAKNAPERFPGEFVFLKNERLSINTISVFLVLCKTSYIIMFPPFASAATFCSTCAIETFLSIIHQCRKGV